MRLVSKVDWGPLILEITAQAGFEARMEASQKCAKFPARQKSRAHFASTHLERPFARRSVTAVYLVRSTQYQFCD
jgi:hypothetical protein